jgi:cytochrome c-type biogenesis protein CcmH/NrfG
MVGDHDELLTEVRKVAAWADMQRKVTKWTLVFVVLFMPTMIAFFFFMNQLAEKAVRETSEPKVSWGEMYEAASQGRMAKALQIGHTMIGKVPGDPEGHCDLAFVYLKAGNLDQALRHFEEAYRLFPSERNLENLRAMRQRIKAEPTHR